MTRRLILALSLALGCVSLVATAAAPYAKIAEIPIGGAGGFDYSTPDPVNHRLYVSHGNEVVVVDTEKNTVAGRIPGLVGVHGIAVAPELGKGFITEGRGGNRVAVFDLKTLAVTAKIEIAASPKGEANPDAIMYEPTKKQVWSFNHSGETVTVIDARTNAIVATTKIGGTAESGQADASIGKVFVNLEDTDSVDVIDMTSHAVVGTYKVAPASSPTGMAVDAASHRLFVAGGKSLVMMDTNTGKVVASSPICNGPDAAWYDAAQKLAFASCGDGHITVLGVSGDTLTVAQTIDTARGARTMALDSVTHRLYATANIFGEPATPGGRGAALPDSFHVMVFAQGK
jgi:DNA-binding beta-propeller fold protein YncE